MKPTYWSYWHASTPGAAWKYSSEGAGTYDPAPGSVEGWRFDCGAAPGAASKCAASTRAVPEAEPEAEPEAGPGADSVLTGVREFQRQGALGSIAEHAPRRRRKRR